MSLCVLASCLVPVHTLKQAQAGTSLSSQKEDEKHVQQRFPSYGATTKLSSELNPSRLLDPFMSLD